MPLCVQEAFSSLVNAVCARLFPDGAPPRKGAPPGGTGTADITGDNVAGGSGSSGCAC